MKRFSVNQVKVVLYSHKNSQWTFAKRMVRGVIWEYRVTDNNFDRTNKWTFIVRIPSKMRKGSYIEIRPIRYPNRKCWANIDRRSISFGKGTKGSHRKAVYAKLMLADVSGEHNKLGVHRRDRKNLPGWFSKFRLRAKWRVSGTKASDYDSLVAVATPDNHKKMIQLFFATKIWVLFTNYQLPSE